MKRTGSIAKLFDEISASAPTFLDHQFVKFNQAQSCEKMIELSNKADSTSAVVICDFAEKFKCCQQNATQSAHYGQTPITLFTVAIYHRGYTAMTIASNNEKQTKETVLAYIDSIIELLPITVKKINIWSDNATSQFKNQFIMESLKYFETEYSLNIRWNFFAPMHGKSVVDGIGGSVKRYVRDRIMAQDIPVKSAEDFVEVTAKMEIQVHLVSNSDIETRNKKIGLQKIIKSPSKVVDIKKKHCFKIQLTKSGKKMIPKVIGTKISDIEV